MLVNLSTILGQGHDVNTKKLKVDHHIRRGDGHLQIQALKDALCLGGNENKATSSRLNADCRCGRGEARNCKLQGRIVKVTPPQPT